MLGKRQSRSWVGWALGLLMGGAGCGLAADLRRPIERAEPGGEWLIRVWETEDGLPENSATAMVQTPDHYLWFGTFNGLVRFDGVSFSALDAGNTPELPSSGIVNLHLDRAGRLWVSTLGGLVWRDGERWGSPPGEVPDKAEYIRTFAERSNGDLLLSTFPGGVLEFSQGTLKRLPSPAGLSSTSYLGGVDEGGRWWVGQAGFVGLWTGSAWERRVPDSELPRETPDRFGFAPARDGGFWMLLDNELRHYAHGVEASRRTLPPWTTGIWSLTEDSRGHVWICTSSVGVTQVLPDGRVRTWNEQSGLPYHGVRFAFEDRERNLWIGTSGGGLARLKPRRFATLGKEEGLFEPVVKSVSSAPGGGIWIGSYGGGLFRFDEAGVSHVPLPAPFPNKAYLQSVISDRAGRTWIGTFGRGLHLLESGNLRAIPADQSGGNSVIALFEDSRGRIWISGGRGIACFDSGTFRTNWFEAGRQPMEVHGFGEDARGAIWLSDYESVHRLERDRFAEVRMPDGRAFHEVTCFQPGADGSMWMGSLNEGLYRWRDGALARVTPGAGLPVRGVYQIVPDRSGMWWLTSNRGIVRTEAASLEAIANGADTRLVCQLLDGNDGLASGECPSGQQPVAATDSKGRLWFATLKGIAGTDPALFKPNPVTTPAIVEELTYIPPTSGVAQDSRVERRILPPFRLPPELPAGTRRFEVRFTAPSFVAPGKMKFQFRLVGADDAWRDDDDGRRTARFENIGPGRYVFEVRAANDDGLWSAESTRLAFAVRPHFWQTTWFYVVSAIAWVVAGTLWFQRIRSRIEARNRAQANFARELIVSQEKERARVARELHDDVTQRLARLAIDAGQIERSTAEPGLREGLSGIREGLAQLSEDVHSLSYQLHSSVLDDLGLVEALKAEGERCARGTALNVQVKVSGAPASVPRDASLCLYRVAQEALRNAVRHAGARSIEVSLRGLDGGLQLAIQDDGVGLPPASPDRRPSLGITGMRERVALLGGQLDIETVPGQGTAIIAWLPLNDFPQ